MILGAVIQQPSDRIDYDFDAADLFNGANDFLVSAVATVAPVDLTVTAVVSNSTTAKLWVSGGVADTTYIVELTVTSDAGRIKQDELEVRIQEFN